MAGIEATESLIHLLKTTGDLVKAAKADGSIDWRDLGKLGPEIAAIRDAVKQGPQVQAELADLSEDEIKQLTSDLFDAVSSLVSAFVVA